jgi:hypothetical protein
MCLFSFIILNTHQQRLCLHLYIIHGRISFYFVWYLYNNHENTLKCYKFIFFLCLTCGQQMLTISFHLYENVFRHLAMIFFEYNSSISLTHFLLHFSSYFILYNYLNSKCRRDFHFFMLAMKII